MNNNYVDQRSVPLTETRNLTMIDQDYEMDYLINPTRSPIQTADQLIAQTQAHCMKKAAVVHCSFQLNGHEQWVQLPILYYPDMLKITVNGKAVPYSPSLTKDQYRAYLLATIQLPIGSTAVSAQFTGLPYANHLSEISAALLLLFYALSFLYRK